MITDRPAALIVAHPGHEIRLHGWLEQARPLVLMLTDGRGIDSPARIAAAHSYLDSLGAHTGALFGRFTDQTIYEALLARDFPFFITLVDEIAAVLVRAQINFVVGDAIEGYNPTHDAFRLVLDSAMTIAEQQRGRMLAQYDFPIVRAPAHCPPELRARAIWLNLPAEVFARKLAAARRYYPELVAQITAAHAPTSDSPLRRYLDLDGPAEPARETRGQDCLEQFRVEVLRPATRAPHDAPLAQPFYELRGEEHAAAGQYRQVIRYREHVRPLAVALAAHAAAVG